MTKLTLYVELFARFIVLLIAMAFAVPFLLFYALGFMAEYYFSFLSGFIVNTKIILASTENKTK